MPCANRTTNTDASYVRCPVLTNHLGKSTARVLQQLHYWLSYENLSYGIIHENRQWIRNSYNQWHQQIKKTNQDLAIITIRRAFSDLEKQGIVLSHCFADHKSYMGGNQVKSYTIDYDRLESIVGDFNKTLITRPRSVQEQQSVSTVQTHNRAGDSSSLSTVSVHTNAHNVCSKRASTPDQMSTPPDQMSTPLNRYISNKHSNKLSHFRAPQSIEHTQQRFGDTETIQPDKPAEREEINFSEEMIEFWNEIVEENNPKRKISLNSKRSQNLNSALKQFFESDLAKWEKFCYKITTCKFLMGEVTRFKAPIDWTISFETIQKIQEGGYTFGTREPTYKLKLSEVISGAGETLRTSLSAFTPSMQESEKAITIRESIKKKVDNAQYMSWFSPTEIVIEINESGHEEATLCVPTRFIGERIKNTYSDIYERYFTTYFVGSAEQYLKSRNSHISVSHPQKIDISNKYQEQKIANPVKNICPLNLYNEPTISLLTFSKENRQMERTEDVVDGKSSSIQKETISNRSSLDVDLENAETAHYIIEQGELNSDLLKTPACGADLCLVNDAVADQLEINQARTAPVCDRKDLSLGHAIKRDESNSILIREDREAYKEKLGCSSPNSSAKISVKPYSSTLNDLKIIQIRKKIKNLIPEPLYTQWFQNAEIVIEDGRAFLDVPTHFIKQDIQIQLGERLAHFFCEIRVNTIGSDRKMDIPRSASQLVVDSPSHIRKNEHPSTTISPEEKNSIPLDKHKLRFAKEYITQTSVFTQNLIARHKNKSKVSVCFKNDMPVVNHSVIRIHDQISDNALQKQVMSKSLGAFNLYSSFPTMEQGRAILRVRQRFKTPYQQSIAFSELVFDAMDKIEAFNNTLCGDYAFDRGMLRESVSVRTPQPEVEIARGDGNVLKEKVQKTPSVYYPSFFQKTKKHLKMGALFSKSVDPPLIVNNCVTQHAYQPPPRIQGISLIRERSFRATLHLFKEKQNEAFLLRECKKIHSLYRRERCYLISYRVNIFVKSKMITYPRVYFMILC